MLRAKTPYKPEDVDFYGERIDYLDGYFEKLIDNHTIMSANYCMSRYGKIFAQGASGKLSYKEGDSRQVKNDTIFPICSMSKLFTSTAIFKLMEDGCLRVSQKVGDFIEEFNRPPFDQITIAHLLTHTSGLHADPGAHDDKNCLTPWQCINHFKDENWVQASLRTGLEYKPGTEWAYCSFGFIILGEIISRASGVFAEDYITENIIKPCEMNETSFDMDVKLKDRYTRAVFAEEDVESLGEEPTEGEKEWRAKKIPRTGGSICSTASDIMKFGIMLCNMGTYNEKRIIGRKAIEKMTRLHTDKNIKCYCWGDTGTYRPYGLGPDMKYDDEILYTPNTYFHEGYGTCSLMIDPTEKLVSVWFAMFYDEVWHAEALRNVSSVMWSGLK